jgi:potassium efflux system protein
MLINMKSIRMLAGLFLLLMSASVTAITGLPIEQTVKNGSSQASNSAQSANDPVVLMQEIKKNLAKINEKLVTLPEAAPAEADNIAKRRLYFTQLMYLYQGQLARLADLQRIQQDRIDSEKKLSDWSGFSEPSAHPFLRADELQESVMVLSKRLNELESWIADNQKIGEYIVNLAKTSDVQIRQIDEAIEQAKDDSEQQARLLEGRDLLKLASQLDMARALSFQIEKQRNQEILRKTLATLQLARKQFAVASENVELTQQDIDEVHRNIDKKKQRIVNELKQITTKFNLANKVVAQENSSNTTGQSDQVQLVARESSEQISKLRLEDIDLRLQMLNRMLNYLEYQRNIWDIRWTYAKVTDRNIANKAYTEIARYQELLQIIHQYIDQHRQRTLMLVMDQAIKNIDQQAIGVNTLNKTPENLDFDQVVSYSRVLGTVEAIENLLERCRQELDAKFGVKSFSDYLEYALLISRDFAYQVWQFELFAVEDSVVVDGQQISSKRSITVDKVVTALAILIIGYWIANRLARLIERITVKRFGIEESVARIARRWIMFIQVILLVVASMLVVRIPLTVFAFMGGAVAIGAGFGMQNLLKNLISGLMLLIERPFRPGDLVEVGNICGRITDIGMRSSHILDANGIETLIPNSSFIEQNVTNWTLSNQSVRIVINVGIAYGSPVREAKKLLLDVAEQHGLVLDEPKPQVLLEDFASDALLLGLYVWVELKPDVSWKVIASDLRCMINHILTEHNIEIAFPQRDIHLDIRHPLDVRVTNIQTEKKHQDDSLNEN